MIVGCFLLLTGTCALVGAQNPQQPQQQKPPQQTPAAPAAQQPGAASQTAAPPPGLRVVVLDPAHGGADSGARGPNGAAEKDIVLEFAGMTADSLRREGFQVVMTRQNDEDPSPDDRAAIANAQSNAIFISLHVASTGPIGSVRTYFYLFPTASTVATMATPAGGSATGPLTAQAAPQTAAAVAGFLPWREAQMPYVDQSHELGDLIQLHLAQTFNGSPEHSWSAPVIGLRSVAAPAVAVEVSNVAANPQQLEAMAAAIADGIARGVEAYKAIYPPGGK